MPEISVRGRLKLPSTLQGSKFQFSRVSLQRNKGIVDGLEIAIGFSQAGETKSTLTAIFLDAQSAENLAKALADFINSFAQ